MSELGQNEVKQRLTSEEINEGYKLIFGEGKTGRDLDVQSNSGSYKFERATVLRDIQTSYGLCASNR